MSVDTKLISSFWITSVRNAHTCAINAAATCSGCVCTKSMFSNCESVVDVKLVTKINAIYKALSKKF